MNRTPGALQKNGQAGQSSQPIQTQKSPDLCRMCIATGTTGTTITTGTVIPLTAEQSDTTNPTIDETKLATLASNTLTVKRTGWLLVTYHATFAYSGSTGTLGETNKEVQINAWIEAGGQTMSASEAWTTLSSRLNLTNIITGPVEDTGIVFYHGEHTAEIVSVPDSDEPAGWHGDIETQGTWTVWAWEEDTGDNLQITGAPILTNMTKIAEYASSTVTKQTISGQCMIQCEAFNATANKFLISGTQYAAELKVKASRTYAGEGDAEPAVSCIALTLTVLRIA